MNKQYVSKENGFTLVELIVSIMIFGIIGLVAFNIIYNQANTFNQVFNQTTSISDTRNVIRLLRRDIQNLSVADISTLESSNFVFTNSEGNEVAYTISDGSLTRNETPILTGVLENPFTYLNINQIETAVKDSVRFIGVTLSTSRNHETVRIEEIIYARN